MTLLEGVYADGCIEPHNSGAPGEHILYQGEPSADVVVRAQSERPDFPSRDAVIHLDDRDYIAIQDIEIDANRLGLPEKTRMACARISGDHNILRRLDMHDANGTGVWMHGDPYLTIGADEPNIYEAEWMPHCVLHPQGNWKRPIAPGRGSEGLLEAIFRNPDDTLPTFAHNLLAPGEGLAARTTRGLLFGHGVPDEWLQFEPRKAELETSSEDIVLKSHGAGFMVYESNHVGDYLQMPFELQERVSGEVFVELHKYGNRGVLRAYIDGQRAGGQWDCYLPRPNAEFLRASLGIHTLEAGEHVLRVEVAGKHDDNPTAWIALYGLSIRPEDATELEPTQVREYTFGEWNALAERFRGIQDNRIAEVSLTAPEQLDYRPADPIASEYGARFSKHLDWLTPEQIARFHDPDAAFEAEHFIWDYSQVEN